MQLSDKDIQEFRALWQSEFGENLSVSEAQLCASQILELHLAVAEFSECQRHRDATLKYLLH